MLRNFTLVSIIAFFFAIESKAQCNTVELANTCPSAIQTGFTFVKTFELAITNTAASKKVEKSYVFSNGATYNVALCSSDPNIAIKIFDSSRKEVGTNFANNKFYSSINFPCSATGIYYINFIFDKANQNCGAAVLAFKR